jgi:hypothetical protein
VLLETLTVLSPPSKLVYVFSKVMVGQEALVHASVGPAVRVCPDSVNEPLHVLQSARVESRPSAKVRL